MAILVYADDTNISVRSGNIDIAVRKLNAATGLLEPWFQKWRRRIHTKTAQLPRFPKDCWAIPAVRIQ
jgi:hypothetical protein